MCETGEVHPGIWWGDLKDDLGVDVKIILKSTVRKLDDGFHKMRGIS